VTRALVLVPRRVSPWIRWVGLGGRYSERAIWLTTGDVISAYEVWPASRLPIRCALCGASGLPYTSPFSPLLWAGKILWCCHIHVVQMPWLAERMKERAEETHREVCRLYPRFDDTAAPGEEWV